LVIDEEKKKDNAETLRTQRIRREEYGKSREKRLGAVRS